MIITNGTHSMLGIKIHWAPVRTTIPRRANYRVKLSFANYFALPRFPQCLAKNQPAGAFLRDVEGRRGLGGRHGIGVGGGGGRGGREKHLFKRSNVPKQIHREPVQCMRRPKIANCFRLGQYFDCPVTCAASGIFGNKVGEWFIRLDRPPTENQPPDNRGERSGRLFLAAFRFRSD